MSTLQLIVVVLIVLFAGGDMWSHRARHPAPITGGFGLVVVILILVLLFGATGRI